MTKTDIDLFDCTLQQGTYRPVKTFALDKRKIYTIDKIK